MRAVEVRCIPDSGNAMRHLLLRLAGAGAYQGRNEVDSCSAAYRDHVNARVEMEAILNRRILQGADL